MNTCRGTRLKASRIKSSRKFPNADVIIPMDADWYSPSTRLHCNYFLMSLDSITLHLSSHVSRLHYIAPVYSCLSTPLYCKYLLMHLDSIIVQRFFNVCVVRKVQIISSIFYCFVEFEKFKRLQLRLFSELLESTMPIFTVWFQPLRTSLIAHVCTLLLNCRASRQTRNFSIRSKVRHSTVNLHLLSRVHLSRVHLLVTCCSLS